MGGKCQIAAGIHNVLELLQKKVELEKKHSVRVSLFLDRFEHGSCERGTVLFCVVFERFVLLPILEEIIQFDKHF